MKRADLKLRANRTSNMSLKLWSFLLRLPLKELNLYLDLISRENLFLQIKHPYYANDEYKNVSKQVVPDFFVNAKDDIVVSINKSYYPNITIRESSLSKRDDAADKLKEAREIANIVEFRKNILYKIVFLIAEKQISFFAGGELRPLSMSDLAGELSFAESTISRAVSNKYIKSKKGVYPLKFFFTNAVASKELSSSQVKNFLSEQIYREDKENPLTDDTILKLTQQRFGVKMVRRTITKYRKFLGIVSSKERKKIYADLTNEQKENKIKNL
ncbi:MAG: hypothetical protein LBJ88_04395 [Campylobacteraceae bacterium]|jgi:RNA polymerase sigma-54 factor|nr:hypothetical protein [Campylobacteraceae bacterium]